ncbi:MAG: DUF4203 domain-containing protein [Pseudomonadota bacterium]
MGAWATSRLEELPLPSAQVGLGIVAAIGVLYCFLGYRLFKGILALTGFLLAGSVAAALVGWLSNGHLVAMGVALLVGGLCGAMALFFLYRVGVFCLGFLGLLSVAYSLLHARPEPWAPWAIVGLGLAGGLVALWAERPVMSLATASIGAWLTTYAAALLLLGTAFEEDLLAKAGPPSTVAWGILAAWAFLTVVGAAFQLSSNKKRPKTD